MKRTEAIELLKAGGEIIFDTSPLTFGTSFRNGRAIRYDTVMKMRKDGLLNEVKSPTAHGIIYLTWRGE